MPIAKSEDVKCLVQQQVPMQDRKGWKPSLRGVCAHVSVHMCVCHLCVSFCMLHLSFTKKSIEKASKTS